LKWLSAHLAVAVALCGSPSRALAEPSASRDETRADASATFREAQAAFARRDFLAAAAAFEQAARAAPHPATWLNAAEAWEKREDWARAAEDCDRAIEVAPADAGDLRHEAETRLQRALEHVATLDVRGARSYGVRIDRDRVQPLPVRRRLGPGLHEVVLVDLASGREERRSISLVAAQSMVIESPVATPIAPPPARGPPTATWILLGVGGAAGIASAVLGVSTLGDKRSFEERPTQDGLDRFHRDRLVTNVFLGVSVIAVGAGLVTWMIAPRNREQRRP
jgi:hypothetical protein